MDKVLFISRKAHSYFRNHMGDTKQIVDYFDIEVQKVLSVLKYKYKNNPKIIFKDNTPEFSEKVYYYDLDNYVYIKKSDESRFGQWICVLYECH